MWLYVPNTSTSSPSAPEAADSISASSWQFKALEQSAWSRGKPSRSRNWYQLWKRASWLQRLFGAMPDPSTAAHGVAQWTALLVASRASLTASPVSASGKKTSAISGQRPVVSSSSPERGSSLSKTSAACSLRAAPNASGETFADWASRLREDCSRRQNVASLTSASASSSSRWPTATARDWKDTGSLENVPENCLLGRVAANWPTPRVSTNGGIGNGDRIKQSRLEDTASAFSHQKETISKAGEQSSTNRRTLNPLFVEWLMGWPPGWTLLAWTDFACSATELCLFKQRMRSALLSLGLPREAPPAQLALFG